MKTKQCQVIQDLLPLYIDNVCSEESRRMVSEHLESCDECKSLYENMIESVKQDLEEPKLDSQQAFSAINRKWKMKKISIISISVVLTALVVFIGYMIVQNVSSVHD
jgi:predicted anti-sigma-YlaC factor YlaD